MSDTIINVGKHSFTPHGILGREFQCMRCRKTVIAPYYEHTCSPPTASEFTYQAKFVSPTVKLEEKFIVPKASKTLKLEPKGGESLGSLTEYARDFLNSQSEYTRVEFKFDRNDRELASKILQGIPLRVSRHSKYINALNSVRC